LQTNPVEYIDYVLGTASTPRASSHAISTHPIDVGYEEILDQAEQPLSGARRRLSEVRDPGGVVW
jgi:hypothetical protein